MNKKYFTVAVACRIGSGSFVPGVCYEMNEFNAGVVAELAEAGRARIYDEEVRMVSGRAIPVSRKAKATASMQAVKAAESGSDVSAVSSGTAVGTTQPAQTTAQTVVRKPRGRKLNKVHGGIRF